MAVVKSTIKEQVYIEMKNRILAKEYAPGSLLNIVHLSREFEVSNSPIREALAMLEKEGLVIFTANSKYRVVILDEEHLQELNAAIVTLLIGAVRLCIRENKIAPLVEKLSQILARQMQLEGNPSQEDKYWLAIGFDRVIVDMTENEMLIQAFDNWCNLLYLSTSLIDNSGKSIQEHKEILAAIRGESLEAVIQSLEKHYDKHM